MADRPSTTYQWTVWHQRYAAQPPARLRARGSQPHVAAVQRSRDRRLRGALDEGARVGEDHDLVSVHAQPQQATIMADRAHAAEAFGERVERNRRPTRDYHLHGIAPAQLQRVAA